MIEIKKFGEEDKRWSRGLLFMVLRFSKRRQKKRAYYMSKLGLRK